MSAVNNADIFRALPSFQTNPGSRNDMARSRVTSCDFYIDAIYWQTSMYYHPFILDYSVTSRTIFNQ